MKKILLASHKRLAFGLKDTLEMFLGQTNSILAICAYMDSSQDHIREIQDFIDSVEQEDAIIFTDIYGGSVNQQVVELVIASKKNIMIVTSMNLPIVLSVALTNVRLTPELICDLSKDCIPRVVETTIEKQEEGGLDDFFG